MENEYVFVFKGKSITQKLFTCLVFLKDRVPKYHIDMPVYTEAATHRFS